MDDDALLAAFEAGTLPAEGFGHREHVRLAWIYLRAAPLLPAIAAFSAALLRFARKHGAEHRYHETVTWAYLVLIHERLERGGRSRPWEEFIAANGDLLDRAAPILRRYYSEATLGSELSRRVFILPDAISAAPRGAGG